MKNISFLLLVVVILSLNSEGFAQSFFNHNKGGVYLKFGLNSTLASDFKSYFSGDTLIKTSLHPKISLLYTETFSPNGGSFDASSGHSYKKNIRTFRVGDSAIHQIGHRGYELLKFLAVDPEAHRHFKNYKRSLIVSTCCAVLSGITFIPVIYNASTGVQNPATAILWGMCGVSFTSFFVFRGFARMNIKRSVKIYNKNSGYGYVNGLEQYQFRNKSISL